MEALQRQLRLVESIIRHIPAAIAFRDPDSTLRWVNPAYLRLLGLPAERVLNRTFPEVFPDQAEAFMPLLARLVATREPIEVLARPFAYDDAAGVRRQTYWDISYVPVIEDDGEVLGTLSLGIEVSSRVEADRAKDEFLSVVSHELRTPLNFITAFASILADGVSGPLNAGQAEHVDRILLGADRMLRLVNDLLDAAKLQAGRLDVDPRPTPLAPIVEEVLRTHEPLAARKGVALAAEVRVAVHPTLDGARLGQVLSNLVANAIKFTPAGGAVAVRARVDDGLLLLEVEDTGCGIAAGDVPKLFTRFRQLDMSATRAAAGTGLGLAISKAIVDAHGGAIGVRSTPGVGSTFWASLPL